MATIINNPIGDSAAGAGGIVLGILLVAIIAGALFFMYGSPVSKKVDTGSTINIPDTVNIDVNAPQKTN